MLPFSAIPFSNASAILQAVVQDQLRKCKHLQSPHPITFHQSIVNGLGTSTANWKTEFHGTTIDETCMPATHAWTLRIPSKVYVLQKLLSNTQTYSKALRTLSSLLASEKQHHYDIIRNMLGDTQTVSESKLQWLHVHAHEHMQALTEPRMIEALGAVDDDVIVQQILPVWRMYPHLFDYFVPLNVQHQYEKQIHCSCVHTWSFRKKIYSLEILLPRQSVNKTILNHLCYRMTMMSLLEQNECAHLHLKWFPSDHIKRTGCSSKRCCVHIKPSSDTAEGNEMSTLVWNPFQINTGATYRNSCNSITIWRREEAAKTFIHEMMHGYGWDFDAPEHALHDWVKLHFAVDEKIEIRFYEGYVETWATLLNIYMTIAYFTETRQLPKKTRKTSKTQKSTRCKSMTASTIKKLIQNEQQFVMFQVAKVLVNSGFATWEAFMCTGSDAQTCFSQKTSVFSYFIIRSAHLWDISWFVKTFPSPNFKKKNKKIKQPNRFFQHWFAHLLSIYKSDAYGACINHYMRWLEASSNATAFVRDTMRMTCVEVL